MTRWIVVCAVLAACGGDDDDDDQFSGTPMPTEIGTPIGTPVTATIGAEGATLVSADGAATLIVPPGALAAPTELAIQLITNHAWATTGGAYRLTPDGTTFAVPVELQLRYDPVALEMNPEVLRIAYQDAEQFWAVLAAPTVDTSQQHVRVAVTHFTDFALTEGERLVPDDAVLAVDKVTTVRLQLCFDHETENLDEPRMVPCIDASTSLTYRDLPNAVSDQASVNGIVLGDVTVGQLSPQNSKWLYIAPSEVPASNPVAITVPLIGMPNSPSFLTTNITIVGADDIWTGTAIYTLTNNDTPGITNTQVTRAEVTWTFDEELGSHVPSGTVEYSETGSYDNPPGPPCQITASYTGSIDPSFSSLVINLANGMYAGAGTEINVVFPRTDSCQGTDMFPRQLIWMPSKQGEIDLDNDSIDLDETSPAGAGTTQHVEYHYVKQ